MLVQAYADEISTGLAAREWRLGHLAGYRAAVPWLREVATVVDTSGKSPSEVAHEVGRSVNVS